MGCEWKKMTLTLNCYCILVVQVSKKYVMVCGNPSSTAPVGIVVRRR